MASHGFVKCLSFSPLSSNAQVLCFGQRGQLPWMWTERWVGPTRPRQSDETDNENKQKTSDNKKEKHTKIYERHQKKTSGTDIKTYRKTWTKTNRVTQRQRNGCDNRSNERAVTTKTMKKTELQVGPGSRVRLCFRQQQQRHRMRILVGAILLSSFV